MSKLVKILNYQFTHGTKAWFKQHVNDQFVKKANQLNYRSRAAFKLEEINQKYNILHKRIIDLGSAPGSWSQFALRSKKSQSDKGQTKFVAVDILDMKPIEGIDFYKCDARDRSLHKTLIQKYGYFDSIISDMAPNFTGLNFQTHQQILGLNKMCIKLSLELSHQNCSLVMKTTEGDHSKVFFEFLQIIFQQSYRFKPKASRSQSKQFYFVCKKFKKQIFGSNNNSKQLSPNLNNQKIILIKSPQYKRMREFITNQLDKLMFLTNNKGINKKQLKKIVQQYMNV